jgi:hypothetical protein
MLFLRLGLRANNVAMAAVLSQAGRTMIFGSDFLLRAQHLKFVHLFNGLENMNGNKAPSSDE